MTKKIFNFYFKIVEEKMFKLLNFEVKKNRIELYRLQYRILTKLSRTLRDWVEIMKIWSKILENWIEFMEI